MKEVKYLVKVDESDLIHFKGKDISVFRLGRELYRVTKKFNMMLKEYDMDNTEACVRENAKWVIETLGYIRAVNLNPTVYNTKQLNNIWQDYNFARHDEELMEGCPFIDYEYFDESHVEEKMCKHLIDLDAKQRIDLEFVGRSSNDAYYKIWKYLAEGVKENKYNISDYVDEKGSNEYRLYYFANSLVHNNFRVEKYITDKDRFFEALHITLVECFEELVEEYNSYVMNAVKQKNKYWNPQVEVTNYFDGKVMELF